MIPNRMICTIWIICFTILFPFSLPADSTDPEVLKEQIQVLRDEKSHIDEVISNLEGKPAQMRDLQKTLVDTYKNLARQKIRLQGIQLWNGFVGFTSVAMDSLQKVNPGSSVVTWTASFVQDRAAQALPNPPFQAKINRMADDMKSLAPSLRLLDRAMNMNASEVADELVARGIVDNTWVNHFNRTPEAVANSKTVVTGKITLIQERIEPAMKDLYRAKTGIDATLAELSAYIEGAREKSRDLGREIARLEMLLAIQDETDESEAEDYEPALEAPTFETSLNDVPPSSPGQAYSHVMEAWNSLKSNAIDPETYMDVKRRMSIAVSNYIQEQVKPLKDELQRRNDYLFKTLPPILKNIQDRYVRQETHRKASQAAADAHDRYDKAVAAELKKQKQAFLDPMEKHRKETEKGEIGPLSSFCDRMKELVDEPFTVTYLDFDAFEIKQTRSTQATISSGEYWATTLWDQASRDIPRIWDTYQRTIQEKPEQATALGQTAIQNAEALIDGVKQLEAQKRHKLNQAAQMAPELEQNLQVWRFAYSLGGASPASQNLTTYQAWLPHLKEGSLLFDRMCAIYEKSATEDLKWLKEKITNRSQATVFLAKRPQLIKTAKDTVATWNQAKDLAGRNSVSMKGETASRFFQKQGISRDTVEQMKQTVSTLRQGPEHIQKHLLTKLAAGNTLKVPDEQALKTIQEAYRSHKESVRQERKDYARHYEQYINAFGQLEEKIFNTQSILTSAAPGQAESFSIENIMRDAGQTAPLNEWILTDPADLPEPDPADDQLVDEFVRITTEYNRLVDPHQEKIKKQYETSQKRMLTLANTAGPAMIGRPDLTPEKFEKTITELHAEAKALYEPVAFLDTDQVRTDIGKHYQALQKTIDRTTAQYISFWRSTVFEKLADAETGGKTDDLLKELSAIIEPGSFADRHRQDNQVKDTIAAVQEMIDRLSSGSPSSAQDAVSGISELYQTFAAKYSAGDVYGVVALLENAWSTPDGGTISDLETMLNHSFSVFDQVEYTISDLSVSDLGNGTFQASYSARIIGTIYDQNLRHEENSGIVEIVGFKDGAYKILSTRQGKFWQ